MKYILGVDAGNTKTIALVARLNGTIVGYGRGGCGDIYNAGPAETAPAMALQNVDDAVHGAMRSSGCNASDIVASGFSMAGADWPEDFSLIEEFLKKQKYGKRIALVNDAVGALKAGAVDDWGVAVANGTGAAISSRSPEGKLWHASWWQEGGGARSLGIKALSAVYRAELGIAEPTSLAERILAFYGLEDVEELLHRFSRRVDPDTKSARHLARLVLDVAEEGDRVARDLVTAEGANLGDYVLAAARKVGIADRCFPLVLTGSVFKHDSSLLTNALLARVHSCSSGVIATVSQLEPCAGALVIALQATNVRVNEKIRSRLKASMPATEFFIT